MKIWAIYERFHIKERRGLCLIKCPMTGRMSCNDQNVDKLTIKQLIIARDADKVPTNADNSIRSADKVSITDEMAENMNRRYRAIHVGYDKEKE